MAASQPGNGEQPEPKASAPKVPSAGTPWWVQLLIVMVVAAAGIGAGRYFFPPHVGAPNNPVDAAAPPPVQTEAAFVAQFQASNVGPEVLDEWRAARGDHKIISYTIANCELVRKGLGSVDTMTRRVFSALMLDLTPDSGHEFSMPLSSSTVPKNPGAASESASVGSSPDPAGAQTQVPVGSTDIKLTSYEEAALFLSDSIARTRIEAAAAASDNYPKMKLLGWVTIGISAAATLLITIKSSMSAPDDHPHDTNDGWSRWITSARKRGILPSHVGFRRFIFFSVGLLAMVLSATVTALTSVKQFYDPIASYKTSEAALIGLRTLHNQVALDFARTWDDVNCAREAVDDGKWQTALSGWETRLENYEVVLMKASANLQDADLTGRDIVGRPESTPKPSPEPTSDVMPRLPTAPIRGGATPPK